MTTDVLFGHNRDKSRSITTSDFTGLEPSIRNRKGTSKINRVLESRSNGTKVSSPLAAPDGMCT